MIEVLPLSNYCILSTAREYKVTVLLIYHCWNFSSFPIDMRMQWEGRLTGKFCVDLQYSVYLGDLDNQLRLGHLGDPAVLVDRRHQVALLHPLDLVHLEDPHHLWNQ